MLTVWIWYRPQRISLPLIWLFGFFCDAVFQQPLGLNGAMLVALVFACRQIQVLMVDFDKKFQYAIFLFCLLTVLLIKSAIEGFTTGTELVIWSLGPVLSAVMLTIVLALFRPLWVRIVDE